MPQVLITDLSKKEVRAISLTSPDFVIAYPTRNSLTHEPQRERDILKTSRIGYGGAILFISQRVTQTKIITSDYQIVTVAL